MKKFFKNLSYKLAKWSNNRRANMYDYYKNHKNYTYRKLTEVLLTYDTCLFISLIVNLLLLIGLIIAIIL